MVYCWAYVLLGAPGPLHPGQAPTLLRRWPQEQWGAGRPRERGELHCWWVRNRTRGSVFGLENLVHVNDDHHDHHISILSLSLSIYMYILICWYIVDITVYDVFPDCLWFMSGYLGFVLSMRWLLSTSQAAGSHGMVSIEPSQLRGQWLTSHIAAGSTSSCFAYRNVQESPVGKEIEKEVTNKGLDTWHVWRYVIQSQTMAHDKKTKSLPSSSSSPPSSSSSPPSPRSSSWIIIIIMLIIITMIILPNLPSP